jgi:hypothetical protein
MSHFHPNDRAPDKRRETAESLSDSDPIEAKEKKSGTYRNYDKRYGQQSNISFE